MPDLNDVLRLKDLHRFPDGGAAHSVPIHQRSFGGQLIARLQARFDDRSPDLLCNDLCQSDLHLLFSPRLHDLMNVSKYIRHLMTL